MKKSLNIFLPLLIITCSFLFTSCTREYTCQCTITYSGQPGLPDSIIKSYPITDTKKGAESKCEGSSDSIVVNGVTTVEDCTIW